PGASASSPARRGWGSRPRSNRANPSTNGTHPACPAVSSCARVERGGAAVPPRRRRWVMSNGARHALGVLYGLILTPVIAACMLSGTETTRRSVWPLACGGGDRCAAAAALLLAGGLLGRASSAWLSTPAWLVPGPGCTGTGLLWTVAARWSFRNLG